MRCFLFLAWSVVGLAGFVGLVLWWGGWLVPSCWAFGVGAVAAGVVAVVCWLWLHGYIQ